MSEKVSLYAMPGVKMELNPKSIFLRVCHAYHVNPDEVMAKQKSRKRDFVEVRQITMYLIRRKLPHLSFNKIGKFFNKDHATALHSFRTVENLRDTDKNYRELLETLL